MRRHGLLLSTVLLVAAAAAEAGAPQAYDPAVLRQGERIYQQSCAACHGAKGEGAPNWQQRNSVGELPPPSHDEEGHTWKHSDAMLYRMVKEGWRNPFNKTDRLTMPAFGEQLSPQEIAAVITYLKTLWTPEQRQFQEEETKTRGGFPPEVNAEQSRRRENQ